MKRVLFPPASLSVPWLMAVWPIKAFALFRVRMPAPVLVKYAGLPPALPTRTESKVRLALAWKITPPVPPEVTKPPEIVVAAVLKTPPTVAPPPTVRVCSGLMFTAPVLVSVSELIVDEPARRSAAPRTMLALETKPDSEVRYSLELSARRLPVAVSAVAKEVPVPEALASTSAQGRMPLLIVPAAPAPTKVKPVVVEAMVATPLPGAEPRALPRKSAVAPVPRVGAPRIRLAPALAPAVTVIVLSPRLKVAAPSVSDEGTLAWPM